MGSEDGKSAKTPRSERGEATGVECDGWAREEDEDRQGRSKAAPLQDQVARASCPWSFGPWAGRPCHREAKNAAGHPSVGWLARRRWPFFSTFRAAGKAVQIGHSCAAVTHQSRPPPCGHRTGTANRRRPVKAGARPARLAARKLQKSKIPSSKKHRGFQPLGLFGICPFGVWDLRTRCAPHAESEHPSRDPHALGAEFLRAPTAKSSSQK